MPPRSSSPVASRAPTGASSAEARPAARGKAGLRYMPGIDGLRALAVIAVLLYHADVPWWKGGFLGVEVFFVISGYLITSLLLADKKNLGRVRLRDFWLRRARRLLPALYTMLSVVTVYALLFVHDATPRLRGDVPAALGYYTNWWLIFSHQSYFVNIGREPLLQHLWSLAVEEQFYLVWPLLFSAGLFFWGHRRGRMIAAILAAAASSSILMAILYTPYTDPSRVYFGTDTRASGLLIGAALAMVWAPWRLSTRTHPVGRLVLEVSGLGSLACLFLLFHRVGEYAPVLYRGGFVMLGLTSAVAIAVAAHPATLFGRVVLGNRPMQWIGQRSYGIYIWHWPIFEVTRPYLDIPLTGLPLLVLRIGLTVGIAELSYRYVEQPVRHGALGGYFARVRAASGEIRQRLVARTLLIGASAGIFVLVIALALVAVRPPKPPPELLGGSTAAARGPGPVISPSGSAKATSTSAAANPGPAGTTAPGIAVTTAPGAGAPPPPATAPPAAAGSVIGIGDSVMLGARVALQNAIPGIIVNAQVSRQFGTAIDIARAYQAQGALGRAVVIHMGTNGLVSPAQIDALLDALSGVPKVLVLNLKVPRGWESQDNQVLADGVARHPNAVLIDWHDLGGAHPEFFYNDGIHLRPPGAQFYAALIKSHL